MKKKNENTRPKVVDRRRVSANGEAKAEEEYSPSQTAPPNPAIVDAQACLSFPEAMRLVAEGKRLTKLEWESPQTFIYLFLFGKLSDKAPSARYVAVHHPNGEVDPLMVSEGDLTGNDWVLLND